jgi:catechol 2,3-dioxygenase-like lactoylglutathione lyase family enzyme
MSAVGLNHYNIRVPEALLEPVKDFYGQLLGIVPGPRPQTNSRGYWLYAGTEPIVHLSIVRGDTQSHAANTGWLDHVAFTCRDVQGTIERIKSMGLEHRYVASPGERLVQVFVHDPSGLRVELNFADVVLTD